MAILVLFGRLMQRVCSLANVLGDSERLLTGGGDNFAKLWDVQYGKEISGIPTDSPVRWVQFSDSNKQVLIVTDAVMGQPSKITIYDVNNMKKPVIERTMSGPKITVAAWSLKDKFVYTCHEDGTMNLWEAKVIKH